MSAVNNTTVAMEATDGTVITVKIPVGSMDEPTSRGKDLMMLVEGDHWKDSTKVFSTRDRDDAEALAYTLDWYHGGHEMESSVDGFTVWSKGYYVYTGG